jgi:hypothetical protein
MTEIDGAMPRGGQEQDMWNNHKMNFDNDGFNAGGDPDNKINCKQEDFNRRVNQHGLWSGVDEIPGNVNLDSFVRLWDENEHDDLLLEVLQNLGLFDSPHPASIEFCSLFLTATGLR